MLFNKGLYKITLTGLRAVTGAQSNQDFAAAFAYAHCYKAQKAFASVIVVSLELVNGQQGSDGLYYSGGSLVLKGAAVGRGDFAGGGLPYTAYNSAAGVAIGAANLAAVVEGILHADYRLYTAVFAQNIPDSTHFVAELLGIVYIQLAAAAFFIYGTAEFFFHQSVPFYMPKKIQTRA